MAYVPLNNANFMAIFGGVIAGMFSGGLVTDANQPDYATGMAIAQAFSQQFDTTWGATSFNVYEQAAVTELCEANWVGRGPTPSLPTNPVAYATAVNGMIACLKAGDTSLAGQAIPIPNSANYCEIINPTATSIHSQTSGGGTVIAALLLQPKSSGIFDVRMNIGYSDGTTAGQIVHTLIVAQATAPVAGFAGGSRTGFVSGGGVAAGTANSDGMLLNVDAAGGAGLTYNGAAVSALGGTQAVVYTDASLTGLLTANGVTATGKFQFAGIVRGAANVPFTFGTPVIAYWQLNNTAAHVISYAAINFSIQELQNA